MNWIASQHSNVSTVIGTDEALRMIDAIVAGKHNPVKAHYVDPSQVRITFMLGNGDNGTLHIEKWGACCENRAWSPAVKALEAINS